MVRLRLREQTDNRHTFTFDSIDDFDCQLQPIEKGTLASWTLSRAHDRAASSVLIYVFKTKILRAHVLNIGKF